MKSKSKNISEFYNNKRLTEEANDIIKNIEAFMKLISRKKAKEIIKFETYCNPIMANGKIISPSSDIRAYHDIFHHILFSRFILFSTQSNKSLDVEHKIMNKIYAHFYKKPKNYKSGAYLAGGFQYDMFKAKAENKKMNKNW